MNDYRQQWLELNARLREIEQREGNLRPVFRALRAHQIDSGFLREELETVQRFEFCHPEFRSRCLRIQFNPDRAARFAGAGKGLPTLDAAEVNGGCFLCPDNIRWQQQERQIGYELQVQGRPFIAWMNPFPLLPGHIVVASNEHQSQEWSLHPGGQLEAGRIISDIVELVSRAPGCAGFYNGVEAGASITGHLHYQLFPPLPGQRLYPLQIEAEEARGNRSGNPGWRLGEYPMESMHWYGEPAEIITAAADFVRQWAGFQGRIEDLTANILAISDEQGPGVSLFFVPRDRQKNRAPGLSGKVGGLEVLGELVFSTPEECELLQNGQVDYFSLVQALAEVRTPLNMP